MDRAGKLNINPEHGRWILLPYTVNTSPSNPAAYRNNEYSTKIMRKQFED